MRFQGSVLDRSTKPAAVVLAAVVLLTSGCGGGGGGVTVVPGPPATPANLTATSEAASSRVVVKWDAAAGATSYVIFRDPALTASVRPRDTAAPSGGTPVPGTTYDDTTVQDGTTYTYQIQALNGAGGTSAKSASSAPVTYTAKPGVTILFSGAAASSVNLALGAPAAFTAAVSGLTPKTVTWSVQEGMAGGTIDASGNYTAPATVGVYHVVAVSQADPSKQAIVTVIAGGANGTATVTVQ